MPASPPPLCPLCLFPLTPSDGVARRCSRCEYRFEPTCPACGYSLRGQTEDVGRCPECGARTSLSEITRDAIEPVTNPLVSSANTCVFVALLTCVVEPLLLLAKAFAQSDVIMPLIVLCPFPWFIAIARFQRLAGNCAGWRWALFLHHAALGSAVAVLSVGALSLLSAPIQVWILYAVGLRSGAPCGTSLGVLSLTLVVIPAAAFLIFMKLLPRVDASRKRLMRLTLQRS